MKLKLFYVHDITPGTKRRQPIGAWIHTGDGSVDYAFSPDYPQDEQIASDAVNRLIENEISPVQDGFLEYWRENVGYLRSASEIESHETDNYAEFFKKLLKALQ